MTDQQKPPAAAKPAAAPKPPKKLIPRPAPKAAAEPTAVVPPVDATPATPPATTPAVTPAVTPAAAAGAKARPARKPSRVDETVARHQAALADALVKAQAIRYDQPKVMKQPAAKPAKAGKPAKVKKTKLVRDSYAMPEAEYAKIGEIKKRLAGLGAEAKKSEVLRAGIAVLAALNDAELKAVMARVERIKTGRPSKDVKK